MPVPISPLRNNGRLFLLADERPIWLETVAVTLVEFEVPERRNESGQRKGWMILEEYLPFRFLDGLGKGETLEVVAGPCFDPHFYDAASVVLRFSGCRLRFKKIWGPITTVDPELQAVSLQIGLDCWIAVVSVKDA